MLYADSTPAPRSTASCQTTLLRHFVNRSEDYTRIRAQRCFNVTTDQPHLQTFEVQTDGYFSSPDLPSFPAFCHVSCVLPSWDIRFCGISGTEGVTSPAISGSFWRRSGRLTPPNRQFLTFDLGGTAPKHRALFRLLTYARRELASRSIREDFGKLRSSQIAGMARTGTSLAFCSLKVVRSARSRGRPDSSVDYFRATSVRRVGAAGVFLLHNPRRDP